MSGRAQVNFRLTDEVRAVLDEYASHRGITRAAVVEQALRDFLEGQGFPVPPALLRPRGRPPGKKVADVDEPESDE